MLFGPSNSDPLKAIVLENWVVLVVQQAIKFLLAKAASLDQFNDHYYPYNKKYEHPAY